jgi:methionyl-tRNA synthetase
VTIDEFRNVDLRVGKIISAERVEGSEKLLKLQVDMGESRQIISGIAKAYAPENLVGKQVVLVANLDPRQLMGMESRGMLLAAHGENGEPALLTVLEEMPPGSKIS